VDALLLSYVLLDLVISEISMAGGDASKRDRVNGVLGFLLVVNVTVTVLPVREVTLVLSNPQARSIAI